MSTEVALITGAGSGIGRAVALAFATRGARIAVLDRADESARNVVSEIEALGSMAIAIRADVADDDHMRRAFQQASGELGPISTVVANAGADCVGEVTSVSLDDWNKCLAVNLTGVFLTAKHGVPHLLTSKNGSFVAIASAAGVKALAGNAAYSAAKHGVVGLVKTLAVDYPGSGVRFNVVCPGFIETPMVEDYFADLAPKGERDRRVAKIPSGRLGTPTEVAHLVAHLTSEAAGYINGAVQVIDGGAYAGFFDPRAVGSTASASN